MCEEVEVQDFEQLQIVVQVAVTHPKSLQQLRRVHNGMYMAGSLAVAADRTERNMLYDIYLKVTAYYVLWSLADS